MAKYHSLDDVSQVAYFLSWPTLGSAIILVMMPNEDKMRQVRHLPLQKRFLFSVSKFTVLRSVSEHVMTWDRLRQVLGTHSDTGHSRRHYHQPDTEDGHLY